LGLKLNEIKSNKIKENGIEVRADEKELDKRLHNNLKKKEIEGEQWFRNAALWQRITAYGNPYATVYSELFLLQKDNKIIKYLNKHGLVFWGVGTCDSELVLLIKELKKEKYIETVAIDVNKEFLETFIQCLLNLRENGNTIKFNAYNMLFQQAKKKDFNFENSKYCKKAHICLGNTIGNFRNNEIFEVFKKNINGGDKLVIGFHLSKNLDRVFRNYSQNELFDEFLLGIKGFPNRKHLKWKLNKEKNQIEAWYKDILLFKSKKFDKEELKEELKDFGFKFLVELCDDNSCIQLYEKN